MDTETKKIIEALEERVRKLEAQGKSLEQGSTLPLEVERAFIDKGFVKYGRGLLTFNALDHAFTTLSVDLTGNAETISTMGVPDYWAEITEGAAIGLLIPLYLKPRSF